MSSPLHTSTIRTAVGGSLALVALILALILLPDAKHKREEKHRTAKEAADAYDRECQELKKLEGLKDQIDRSQKRLQTLLANLPSEDPGQLQWRLSNVLHKLTRESGVRLQAVKYASPTREGTKGSGMEVMEAEFTVMGLYSSLKLFMQALEASELPFALSRVRLEETPEGARISATLRSFRQAPAGKRLTAAEATS